MNLIFLLTHVLLVFINLLMSFRFLLLLSLIFFITPRNIKVSPNAVYYFCQREKPAKQILQQSPKPENTSDLAVYP